MKRFLKQSQRFQAPGSIYHKADLAGQVMSLGHHCGEGWFLTAEMIDLIQTGVPNIVCLQPFGCLPNHVTGKGMLKKIRRQYPQANITSIDYDPGASEVNQLNRLKLLLSMAFKNMQEPPVLSAPPRKVSRAGGSRQDGFLIKLFRLIGSSLFIQDL